MVLGDMLRLNAFNSPHKLALVYRDTRLTYSELNQRANGLANALLSIGVTTGERVAVLSHNCSQYVETYFAAAKGGMPIVPLNTNVDADGMAYIINDSGANTLIFADKYLDLVNELRPELGTVKQYIAMGNVERAESYEELVASHSKEEPEVSVDENDIAWMLYTSGTTGRPKGVMLSHKSQIADSANTILTCYPISRNDVHLSLLPMFHIGCMWHMRCHFYMGSTNVLMDTVDPKMVLETIERERVSTTCIVPPMAVPIINYQDVDKYDVSSMHIIIYSGAPMSEAMMARMNEIFGDIVIQVYALTEGGPAIIMPPLMEGRWEQVKRKGSCGKAVLNVEVKLINEEGRGCGVGEVGEIVARGDNIMAGYWNMPEETGRVLKDGFLHTGDLASQDEEGYFYFTGRKKDTIASGDKVVYSPEVEDVMSMHPAVLEIAVIGVPDQELGEAVEAIMVLREGKTITREEVMDWCRGKIEDYKMPKWVDFVDSLPKSPSGKVLKTVLKERYSK